MSFVRTCIRYFNNVIGESPSFRAKPVRNLQIDIAMSPYKEQFKDFWATPVPWALREYGPKPKIGDPVPLRNSAGTLICAFNRYADQVKVANNLENDYKVLMMFRQSRGRFTKDQFIFPSTPVHAIDRDLEGWGPVFKRRGVNKDAFSDITERLCAFRSLLVEFNLLLIPPEGGGLAEVEGPPGPKKWHMMVMSAPRALRDLVDALELPMHKSLSHLTPFRRVQTPASETFRFDNYSYIVPFDKIPCVKYCISTVGEQLVWVSPREAIERYNDGRMEMPTPNLILLSELANCAPTFADVKKIHSEKERVPEVILPELVRHPITNMATVLMPGDLYHSSAAQAENKDKFFHRFYYEKDWPHGVHAVYIHRPVEPEDDITPLPAAPHAIFSEINEMDKIYLDVPYPKRDKMPTEVIGTTNMPIPSHQLSDGPVNEEGVVIVPGSRHKIGLSRKSKVLIDSSSDKNSCSDINAVSQFEIHEDNSSIGKDTGNEYEKNISEHEYKLSFKTFENIHFDENFAGSKNKTSFPDDKMK